MKVLVTGGSGFIGRYLCERLATEGHSVTATYLSRPELSNRLPLAKGIQWLPLDLRDGPSVGPLVRRVRPEAVFHLAAQAYAGQSWKDPADTFATNVLGTIHLYEALRNDPPARGVLLAASASAYGSGHPMPIGEDAPFRPINPYGVSKASQELLSYQYYQNYDLRIVRARLFITTGPGKRGDALNDFAEQIARAERTGRPGELQVGNLETRRDISDVRDVVRAILRVFEAGRPEEPVNIGRGESHSIRWIVERLREEAQVPIRVRVDRSRLRPSDEPEIRADVRRLAGLGCRAELGLERTIHDALEHWRGESTERRPAAHGSPRAPRRAAAGGARKPRRGTARRISP